MKKIIFSGLLVAGLFLNTGCRPSEIAAGAIGVGIGIGIGSSYNDHHHHDHRRRSHHRRCGYHRCYTADGQSSLAPSQDALAFAQKHQVSVDVATRIEEAFAQVPAQGLEAFASIGLSKKDLRTLSSRSMPGPKSLANIANHLDISEAQARDLLKSLIQEFATQASDVQSPYWQACMAKGQWKTPQNARCTTTSWEGCSPASGATLCF